MQETQDIFKEIDELIKNEKVVLFMKGSEEMPMCGFSGTVVEILKECNADFVTRDVLQDDLLRSAIKEYSDWPTLPQLYINGEFIGGCDIVTQLFESGELQKLLG